MKYLVTYILNSMGKNTGQILSIQISFKSYPFLQSTVQYLNIDISVLFQYFIHDFLILFSVKCFFGLQFLHYIVLCIPKVFLSKKRWRYSHLIFNSLYTETEPTFCVSLIAFSNYLP